MWVTKKRFDAIVKNTSNLERNIGILVSSIDNISTIENASVRYNTKVTQVSGLRKKFQGIDTWGNALLQRLISLRVAFSVPNRLFLLKNPNISATDQEVQEVKSFLNDFLVCTTLDSKLPRDLAIESELQGQIAVELTWEEKNKLPELKYYPWADTGYTIKQKDKYKINSELKFNAVIDGIEKDITDEYLCFLAFNDELLKNEGYPTCGGILQQVEDLSKDLNDWRKLNHLFAHPTPHFKCESQEEANLINERITAKGWKVGSAIASNADFQLKGPTGAEGTLLMLSIQTNAKIISGHTGLGIHFLGFPNVMSNRAVAESIGEPTEIVLHSEITSWHCFYTNMFNKAIRLRNNKLNKSLRENVILPKIVPMTDRQWKTVKDIYMPAINKGLVSHQTFLDRLPDIDTADELERIKEEEDRAELKIKNKPVTETKKIKEEKNNFSEEDKELEENIV